MVNSKRLTYLTISLDENEKKRRQKHSSESGLTTNQEHHGWLVPLDMTMTDTIHR